MLQNNPRPIPRLPIDKTLKGFSFPGYVNPNSTKIFANRKIPIISVSNLRHLGKIPFESTHIGTLKKRPFLN